MSDDFSRYRPEVGDEDEDDEANRGREAPFGWPDEEPDAAGKGSGGWFDDEPGSGRESRGGWPDDDTDPGTESPGSWPVPAPTWQRQDYGEPAPREWERPGDRPYDEYGYARTDEPEADRYDPHRSRDPLARLFPGLPRGVRVTLDWILTIAGAILIVLALKQWVVNPYRIPSSSMEPTLNCAKGPNPNQSGCLGQSSDRVLACRICLDFGPPSRGDIVVFNTPKPAAAKCGEGGTFVKRVIGLPGDTVRENRQGFILVRSPGSKRFVKLKEPYLSQERRLADSGHFGMKWHVPPNEYFMMGDNRAQSCDSRTWGSVPRSKLIGIVFFVYWPPDRIGFR
jgi:signal peptidase I